MQPDPTSQETSTTPPVNTFSNDSAPPVPTDISQPGTSDFFPPSAPKPPSNFSARKVISTAFGFLLLVGGLAAGTVLVQQPQLFNQKAAVTYTVNCDWNRCVPVGKKYTIRTSCSYGHFCEQKAHDVQCAPDYRACRGPILDEDVCSNDVAANESCADGILCNSNLDCLSGWTCYAPGTADSVCQRN